jgi:ribosomal protein S18 acetylase RimI-like enzyme
MSAPVYSSLDSDRFGVRVFRAAADTLEEARAVCAFLDANAVDMLIARCPTHALEVAQHWESAGFFLTDTLVYFGGDTARFELAPPRETRLVCEDDRASLEAVARAGFTDFRGHYHTDPKLDASRATEGYVEWCLRSTRDPHFEVWVTGDPGDVTGFLTLQTHGPDRAEIVLNAVSPRHQRKGIYDALVRAAGSSCRARGIPDLFVSTQLSNLAPQKVWVRHGMEPRSSFYTFHRWPRG